MQRHVKSPEQYVELVPSAQLPLLEYLRKLVQEAPPSAREEIRWGCKASAFLVGRLGDTSGGEGRRIRK